MGFLAQQGKKAAKAAAAEVKNTRRPENKCLGCGETKRMSSNVCSPRCAKHAAERWPAARADA